MSYLFDYPNINTESKSNEANMRAVKAYLNDMTDKMNIYLAQLEERVSALENKDDE